MVVGVEHRVEGVGHVLLNGKGLRHIRRAVEEVLTQYHCDAVPGGAAGEAVGCRHYPAGVDEAPSTETVPNVDGGQPGV